ncbi:TolC family protein [Thiolapillus brandeum]|uniref:Outer membrane channel protein TolC n=1 Tax=Thiolapillus brandeum TaxID=1076588 RepID=A0A7U6JKA1_9GAMM|nr:TolC family protein [Thiolapillus brandeum]BAO45295.1 outer membrane channel protein TolC [Thiolapillus brandeum]
MRRIFLLVVLSRLVLCAGADPLPQPLSLEQALALADEAHPEILLARAEEARAEAELQETRSDDDLSVLVEGRLQYLDPAEQSNFQETNDSQAQLRVAKRLYDFGYTRAREASAEAGLEAARWQGLDARQSQQLKVMKAFFDVLLADLEYTRDNEAVAIAFVRVDKLRERHKLGQVSDLELLKHETQYEKVLSRRTASAARQREMRLRLALAMNRPDELPADLVLPPVPDMAQDLPEVGELYARVLQGNPSLKALRQRITAARQTLEAAARRYGPVLRGEMLANYYNRETRSTSPFSAALVLEMPLYSGGREDAEAAKARARLLDSQARLSRLELELRQQVLDLHLDQEKLRRRAKELRVREEYRDLYLDRSRTLYELERTSDLGDAMVQTSAVKLELARIRFQWLLNRARLRALAGKLLDGQEEKGENG